MQDQTSELDNYHELKFSRKQSFLDKSLWIRLAIGVAFALCLFALIHFREERVEVLELNTLAPGYIVAQVDFDFFDEEATIILRQEAVRDVGKILQISENEIRQRRIEFENFLINTQDWRKASKIPLGRDVFNCRSLRENPSKITIHRSSLYPKNERSRDSG